MQMTTGCELVEIGQEIIHKKENENERFVFFKLK